MEKRTVYQITNVSKINNLSNNASIEACLCCILEQDFKFNKYIKQINNYIKWINKYVK